MTTNEPKARPIIFSGPMVRAILDGRKTQTRRVVKPQPVLTDAWAGGGYWCVHVRDGIPSHISLRDILKYCPYGVPGDRLYAKETWRTSASGRNYQAGESTFFVEYRENSESRGANRGAQHATHFAETDKEYDARSLKAYGAKSKPHQWRPSIFMPRWASRITLEVVSVRVERLQAIAKADAIAEGAEWICRSCGEAGAEPRGCGCGSSSISYRFGYEALWDRINGPGSWDANPFVWVIEFKRVTP